MNENEVTLPPASAAANDVTLPPADDSQQATLAPGGHDATLNQPASTDARAPAGYVIEKELGRGGMGVVYKARSVALQRSCALKVILSGAHSGDAEVARFRTEAQAIARLQHPGIVQVFEIGEHDGKPFMALEFCGGGSLDDVLAKNPLKPRAAAELLMKLAEAMQAAHEAQVLHRDLKPANVLLASPGREPGEFHPKVTDFGLAKKLDEQGATRTGSVMGTPSYMPPEQADGSKHIGPSADVYALGAILYECLAGRPPFRAATPLDTLLQVVGEEPVPMRQLNHQVPVDLETIAHKCLQKDPKKRYASAQDLADDLGRYLKGEPIQARPVGAAERSAKWVRRNKAISALMALVVLVLLAGVAVSSYFAYAAAEEARAARRAENQADSEAGAARKAEAEAKDREKAAEEAKAAAQKETQRAEAEKRRADEQLRRAEWSVYAGKLLLAQSAFAENNTSLAFAYLDDCQWDLRGWEHRHLRRHFDASKQTLDGQLYYPLTGAAWSPDGKRILTGGADRIAAVWDAEKGTTLFNLKGDPGWVNSVAWSPDGKSIITGSHDQRYTVWDAEKGNALLGVSGHGNAVTSVAYSPDGKRILSGSADNTAKVWDADKGTELLTLKGHTSGVTSVAFSPDGKRLLTGSADQTARLWDAQKGTEVFSLKGHTGEIASVAYSPDGKRLLTGSTDKTAKVWDAEKGREILSLRGHTSGVRGVAFSPDGRRILTGGSDSTARAWDAEKGTELFTLKGHTDEVTSVGFSPDGTRILTSSSDRTARVWGVQQDRAVFTLAGHTQFVNGVTWSPDGKRLLTANWDNTAKVLDAEKGTVLLSLNGHTRVVKCMAFSPDGKRILTGGGGFANRKPIPGETKVWDAWKGTLLHSLDLTDIVNGVAWSPDGKRFLTGGWDMTLRVWDAEKGTRLLALAGHSREVTSVAWSRDGKRLLSGSKDGTAKVWDVDKGTELVTLTGHVGEVMSVAFSPDGKHIVTGNRGVTFQGTRFPGEAKVWDADKGTELFSLTSHTGEVTSVAFSPNGQRILTGSTDQTAKLWDAQKGTEVLSLKGHAASVFSAAFSPDGTRILTGSGGFDSRTGVQALPGEAKVWSAESGPEALFLNGHSAQVSSVVFSPDGKRIVSGSADKSARLWDAVKGSEIFSLKGLKNAVARVAFSPDGKRAFAWDAGGTVLAWSVEDGKSAATDDAPARPVGDPGQSQNGRRAARALGRRIAVTDVLRPSPDSDAWPLPDAAERKQHHTGQAALAEKEAKSFAVAFHLGRLLLDDPGNADLKRRRDEALKKHADSK